MAAVPDAVGIESNPPPTSNGALFAQLTANKTVENKIVNNSFLEFFLKFSFWIKFFLIKLKNNAKDKFLVVDGWRLTVDGNQTIR